MNTTPLEQFAKALNDLTWRDMVTISNHLANDVTHRWKNGEPVDRDSMAQTLSDMSEDQVWWSRATQIEWDYCAQYETKQDVNL